MCKWISGQQLLNDFEIRDFELFYDYVQKRLQPHNNLGQPISPLDVVEEITNIAKLKGKYGELRYSVEELGNEELQKFDATRGYDLLAQIENYEKWVLSVKGLDWNEFKFPKMKAEAAAVLTALVNSLYHIEDIKKYFSEPEIEKKEIIPELPELEAGPKKARKHHTDKDRLRAQAKAAELWAGKYKDYTVPELIDTQEMLNATLKPNGTSNYSERVVKDWIKDLNPNKPLSGAPKKRDDE